MSRILLIKPPVADNPRNIEYDNPPMGLLYLASYLRRQNSSRQFKVIDMVLERKKAEDITALLNEFKPDICGITCLTVASRNAVSVADHIKKWNKKCPVVFGGPHASFMPEKTIEYDSVDYCIVGEGEQTFSELVTALENNTPTEHINGIGFRKETEVQLNPPPPFLDIDELPWPAYDLLPVSKYHQSTSITQIGRVKYDEYMTMLTSRACPYGCIYCHNLFGKKFRGRDPESVVEEMVMLNRDYGIREFHMVDDCFNLKKDRALKICELIQKRLPGIAIAFPNGLRSDILDWEMLCALKNAGMYLFAAAIESASPEIQKVIKKNLNLDKAFKAIEDATKLGIIVHGFFMMGFPGETEEQLKMTIEFARKSSLNTAGFFAVTIYPRTELYEIARASGIIPHEDFDQYSYHNTNLNLTDVSLKKLKTMRRDAYRKFYFDPVRLYNIFSMTPRKRDIWRSVKQNIINFF
jgi:anaerobic magnesium-protoporphyrin IX monomethyl ester cyclase